MCDSKAGGISQELVIRFLFRSMFGRRYEYIEKNKNGGDKDGIIKACLCLAWNDAFRHIECNLKTFNSLTDSKKEKKLKMLLKSLLLLLQSF